MLKIRREQIEVFEHAMEDRFVRKAIKHLEKVLPERCQALGPETVEASVRTALAKCREYGIESERDVLRYLNLMYVLDFDFDTSGEYLWVAEILPDRELDPQVRMTLLTEQAREELRRQ